MERFTGEQRAFSVKAYWENGDSCTIARRLFCFEYSLHDLNQYPSEKVIRSLVKKFETTVSTLNQKPAGRPSSIRTTMSVRRDPKLSTQNRSTEPSISRTSLRCTLAKDLKFHPYKLPLVQELKPNAYHFRRDIAERMLHRFRSLNNIFLSD